MVPPPRRPPPSIIFRTFRQAHGRLRASRLLMFMSAQDARGPEENDHQLKLEPCGPRLSALGASKPTARLSHGLAVRHPRSGPPRPPRLVEGLVRRLRWSPRFRGASLAASRVRVPIVRSCRPTCPTESHAAWDGFDADGIGISSRFPIFSALAPPLGTPIRESFRFKRLPQYLEPHGAAPPSNNGSHFPQRY